MKILFYFFKIRLQFSMQNKYTNFRKILSLCVLKECSGTLINISHNQYIYEWTRSWEVVLKNKAESWSLEQKSISEITLKNFSNQAHVLISDHGRLSSTYTHPPYHEKILVEVPYKHLPKDHHLEKCLYPKCDWRTSLLVI